LPDAEFPKHGVGATSQILYHNLFREYKCLLVTHWDSKNIREVVKKVNNQVFGGASDKVAARSSVMNQEDLAAEIDAAMAAMDLPSDFSESLSEPDEDPKSQTAIIGPTAATIVGPADFDVAATADDLPLPVPDSANSEFQQPLLRLVRVGSNVASGRSSWWLKVPMIVGSKVQGTDDSRVKGSRYRR